MTEGLRDSLTATSAGSTVDKTDRFEELSDSTESSSTYDKDEIIQYVNTQSPIMQIPELFTSVPLLKDSHKTVTSEVQEETVEACLPFLSGNPYNFPLGSKGIPRLRRTLHAEFLRDAMSDLPAPFIAIDASRPWFFYWALAGLSFLGCEVDEYAER